MLNVDLSKVLHPRFWDLLPALLPGLFFEACIAIGDPHLVGRLMQQANLGPYPSVVVAIIFAVVLGISFMHVATTVQLILDRIYNTAFENNWLPSRASGIPSDFAARAEVRAEEARAELMEEKGFGQAWRAAATRLLSSRYGIEIDPLTIASEEWHAWYVTLWTPRREDVQGPLSVMATHATGWSGLAAACIAGDLRNWFFLLLVSFLVFVGISNYWFVLIWQQERWPQLALRRTLAAIPQPKPEQPKPEQQGT